MTEGGYSASGHPRGVWKVTHTDADLLVAKVDLELDGSHLPASLPTEVVWFFDGSFHQGRPSLKFTYPPFPYLTHTNKISKLWARNHFSGRKRSPQDCSSKRFCTKGWWGFGEGSHGRTVRLKKITSSDDGCGAPKKDYVLGR